MSFWSALSIAVLAVFLAAALILGVALINLNRKTRPSATGGGKSAGSARSGPTYRSAAKADGVAASTAADTAPEGAPHTLSGATPTVARAALTPDCPTLDEPGERLMADFRCWLDAGMPQVWPAPPVVPGRES